MLQRRSRMAYYNTCPHCGCNLDPGERCDCQDAHERKRRKRIANNLKMSELLEVEECQQIELKLCC